MQLDFAQRELTLKLVYYGPALSGKTTNLVSIHRLSSEGSCGRLMTLETRDDRTLFFDLLPIHLHTDSGVRLRLKVFTVPGQVTHDATRRLVLQATDGVAFIADSRADATQANADSFQNLRENLQQNGLDIRQMPLVIQFNKRDLPDARPDEEIEQLALRGREPVYLAVATLDRGTLETFLGLARLTYESLDEVHDLSGKFGIGAADLVTRLVRELGLPAALARSDAARVGG